MNKKYFYILIGILLTISCFILFKDKITLGNTVTEGAKDLVGTKVGTTTTGVHWGSWATTSYPFAVDDVEDVVITMKITDASTTAQSYVNFELLASNDAFCLVSTTTPYSTATSTKQINWFDASNFIIAPTTSSISTGTTTWHWGPLSEGMVPKQIIIQDLNAQCLRLDLAATSTDLWVQYKTKK